MMNYYLNFTNNKVIVSCRKFYHFFKIKCRLISSKIISKLLPFIKIYIKRILKKILVFMRVVKLNYFADRILTIYHYCRKNSLNSVDFEKERFSYQVINRLNLHYKFSYTSKVVLKDLKSAIKVASPKI